jgi:predicted CXXCH cytochrome family protein
MNDFGNWKITGFVATILIVLSIPLYIIKMSVFNGDKNPDPYKDEAKFVGRDGCIDCHKKENDLWLGSHHDKAMDIATEESVLGDFNNAEFEHNEIVSRFYRKDNRFFVYTQGPCGKTGDFEITHTFGYTPLQQYLVPFENGRLQCLPIAWDTENKKWYHLFPMVYRDQNIEPDDWLYWTNLGQNWNGMCAECHSTNLQKNYDLKTESFTTTWSEIDVSCEACHGPSSLHVDWANLPEMARPEDNNFGLVVQTSNLETKQFVELCAPCHSRRTSLGVYDFHGKDLLDNVVPQLLNEPYYFADGQILEEDYVYGSFTQSKMYMNDVKCNDCHDSHSVKLVEEGNKVCLQCHRADIYDSYDHHFHKKEGEKGEPIILEGGKVRFEVGEGAECVKCHMPGRYYMGIDYRPDHSMRVPRPDLSILIGTPNGCNRCHTDKSAKWSADYITKWYGISRKPHFGPILAAGRKQESDALNDLIRLAGDELFPIIVRASALVLLSNYSDQKSREELKKRLDDPEPLIRQTAVRFYNATNPEELIKSVAPLLFDPVKAVRIQAAILLSSVPEERLKTNQRELFRKVLDEYKAAMEYQADFATGRHNLGNMYSNLGNPDKAIEQYLAALKIDNLFYPAKWNLAMTYNQKGDNENTEKLFREIIEKHPEVEGASYSLGLLLVEKKEFEEALAFLEKAAIEQPDQSRVYYNLGLLYQYLKKEKEAEFALLKAQKIEPDNLDYLYALADYYIKRGKFNQAKVYAKLIKTTYPENPLGKNILDYINKMNE